MHKELKQHRRLRKNFFYLQYQVCNLSISFSYLFGFAYLLQSKIRVLLSLKSCYLSNSVFLSRNYRLIVTPAEIWCSVKTNICLRSEALRANVIVLRTPNSERRLSDRYFRDKNSLLSLLFTTKRSSGILKFVRKNISGMSKHVLMDQTLRNMRVHSTVA